MAVYVDPEIFKRSFTRTPDAITPAVQQLAAEISPEYQPRYVEMAPEPMSRPRECFFNVKAKIERDGGKILYGWAIWEWPRVFLEAEHHAVWSNGPSLIDVTPQEPGIRRVLFVPDPAQEFDESSYQRRPNIKRPLNPARAIADWISETDRFHEYIEGCSHGPVARVDVRTLKALQQKTRYAQAGVLVWLAEHTKRNDLCFCTSGKKFKNCCANFFRPA
ncbi:SEC-C domain-containing protein [Bradyrhizobium sp. SZCCHNRI1073]|uniref:SEC-C domain-containing protein n=1 Tax=Bradyrhizobium sp. SZCCHNRI1073 TaxID=3057280 RepID=UPI0029162D87|nr:SEC-C domain-containing protein [Bradyrhizobium sp. SZCCHNRI1073]